MYKRISLEEVKTHRFDLNSRLEREAIYFMSYENYIIGIKPETFNIIKVNPLKWSSQHLQSDNDCLKTVAKLILDNEIGL